MDVLAMVITSISSTISEQSLRESPQASMQMIYTPLLAAASTNLTKFSCFFQENKESILALAVIAKPLAAGSPSLQCEELRNSALHVLDAVERNGVMPPWTLVPPLIALATDPSRYFSRTPSPLLPPLLLQTFLSNINAAWC